MGEEKRGLAAWCAATVLLSAFLLFLVQPMVSKMILPWFGGSPAVWTTCMLFFQVFLLLGYLYAHLLDRLPNTRWQGTIHLLLLIAAVLVLPIVPDPAWKPLGSDTPQWQILKLLAANVGLPYMALAASAPLIQAWYSRAFAGRLPYRFYALSNFGSLTALLSYPFLIEPGLDIGAQGTLWASAFAAYGCLAGILALGMAYWKLPAADTTIAATREMSPRSEPLSFSRLVVWLVLPAFGSMGLLAVTNQICQDVAVVPFFWVVPLSLYLITFILCFDSTFWYRRNLFAAATLVLLLAIAVILFRDQVQPVVDRFGPLFEWFGWSGTIPDFLDDITIEATLYLAVLFCICMLCHGELVRSKPGPRHLTLFYLLISTGGALGGAFVALLCPVVFSNYIEPSLFLIGGGALAMLVALHSWWTRETRWTLWWQSLLWLIKLIAGDLRRLVSRRDIEGDPRTQIRITKLAHAVRHGRSWTTLWSVPVPLVLLAGIVMVLSIAEFPEDDALVSRRNFYGVLRVVEYDLGTPESRRDLYNGRILHGIQLTNPQRRQEPTTYYSYDSGIGVTLSNMESIVPLRVATVGLGTGTIATYGHSGDHYCFYEINPDVVDIADRYFSFLRDSAAEIHVEIGDARLSMERQDPQNYDVIALDAFSGDAIPAHLLTVEAVAIYLKHLKSNGVLAIHTSNRHLDLVPIVALLAAHYEMQAVVVDAEDGGGVADSSSEWVLVTNNQEFLDMPDVSAASLPVTLPGREIRVWTDQYSNLFEILKEWHE